MIGAMEMPKRNAQGWMPFLIGLPMAGLAWAVVFFTPLSQTEVRRYFSHPVEAVEILMFSVALGAFIAKLIDLGREKKSLNAELLPGWNGVTVDVSVAPGLLEDLLKKPARVRNSWLGQRLAGALEYLTQRKSTDGLDDQLRSLADIDAFALDSTYGLTRFITWAIPILGFLGTVLGITGAISGVTPEVLENSLGTVTDGLALAFDTTALALGLTMVTMFVSFLVEKSEHRFMESVDRYVEVNLSHRFIRESGPHQVREIDPERVELLRRALETAGDNLATLGKTCALEIRQQHLAMADEVRTAGDHLVTLGKTCALEIRQQHLAMADEFRTQSAAAIAGMIQFVQNDWLNRLSQLDERQVDRWRHSEEHAAAATHGLIQKYDELTGKLGGQIRELQALGQSSQHLAQMQHILHQNLASLASVGSFDQAMHSLIGAIHLLTARAPLVGPGTGTGTGNGMGVMGSMGAMGAANGAGATEMGHGPDLMRGPMAPKVHGQHAA